MEAELAVPNALAESHLPWFVTAPGQSDTLFNVMIIFLVIAVFLLGILYLKLHSLPEHMMHGTNKVQVQLVGVLALLALFTHQTIFWVAALLLAVVDIPDFGSPLKSIARSLERIAARGDPSPEPPPPAVEQMMTVPTETATEQDAHA